MSLAVQTIVKRVIIAAVILGVIAAAYIVISAVQKGQSTVNMGAGTFRIETMSTEEERERGLSGRQSLARTDAMLFVFPHDDTWGIWMKEMKFPIDIVWLDGDKKVVYIRENAKPEDYPQTYRPAKKARYVIELAAGTIKDKNIREGLTAKFMIKGDT